MWLRCALAGTVALLSACATVYDDAPTWEKTNEIIVFKRNPGFAGYHCTTAISVNGHKAATVNMGDLMRAEVGPGKHRILAESDTGTCANFKASYYVKTKTHLVIYVRVERE